MKKRTWTVLAAVLGLALAAPASPQEKADEAPRWKGDVSLGLSLARGNAEATSFSFTFSAGGPVGGKLTWENRGIYLFGSTDGRTSAESGLLSSRLVWQHTHRLLSYCEVQALRDRFKNYSSRFLPSAGLGYKLVDTEGLSWVLDAGISGVCRHPMTRANGRPTRP
jgi:putative salt-induced outer membrane protein